MDPTLILPAQPGHVPADLVNPSLPDSVSIVGDPSPAGSAIMAAVTDADHAAISDRAAMSDHAAMSDRVWAAVFERAAIPLSLVSLTGHQIAGNAAYRQLLGYEADELASIGVLTTTRDVDHAWTQAYLARLAAGEIDRYTTEKLFIRKDGTTVRARLEVTSIVEDGRCVALLGALTPVEERRPLGEGMLRKVVENIHDTISLIDAEGRLLETTGRYRPIMGYPAEFWETRSIFDLLIPEDLPRVLELRDEVMRRPGETVTGEFTVISSLNTEEVLEVHAVNLLDDPDIAGIVITSRNITDLRRMLHELRSSRDDALSEAELRSRMLATVSHELRNPLHAVQGIAELLAQSDLPDAERQMAGTINRQIRDLNRVVDDLLTTSRLELDSVSVELEPVDLRSLLVDVVTVARSVAGAGLEVHALIDTSIPDRIVTDPVRLRQVVSNLVGNAVKFTGQGRVRVLASVSTTSSDQLVLEVEDTGTGIPADEIATIFEPFLSASTAGRNAGAGLGLSVVQRITSLLGGEVEVTSELGRGSTFRVTLPLDTGADVGAAGALDAVAVPETLEPSMPSHETPVLETPAPSVPVVVGGPPVLVVEDNAVNQQLARAQLRSLGYDCVVVGSGEEALDHLATAAGLDVEIVLMDYHLPGIDGLETTRRLRVAELPGRHVAVVGVTASASIADRDGCLAAGMDDHLPKPVSLADLSAAFARTATLRNAVRKAPRSAQPGTVALAPAVPPVPEPAAQVAGPAVAELEAAGPAVAVTVLDALAGELGDPAIVDDLIETFLGELPARIDGIADAGASGDRDSLHRLVHTLTSSARLLGSSSLASACREFEAGQLSEQMLRDLADRVRSELAGWVSPR